MSLLQTLVRPDHEESLERAEVAKAANLLQVGEFQLLQLAFHAWHRRDMPTAAIDRIFASYMLYNEVPFWARQYARSIIELEERGVLDDRDPAYHRYDVDYHTRVPDGPKRFVWAVLVVVACLGGGLLIAHLASQHKSLSVLPPYFDRDTIPKQPGETDPRRSWRHERLPRAADHSTWQARAGRV